MGRGDLADDPRFTSAAARRQHRSELYDLLCAWMRDKTRQELWDGLRLIDYFGAPVLSMGEVVEDPHIKERNAFIDRNHPTAGPVKLLAPWIHMSETPPSIRTDSPAIGQHTDEVLTGLLGLNAAELTELRGQGIVK
jgi:crotonobetainyl-CoA:carnitine CoA-transferase CaiB-like acyl-CoA transferase